MLLEKSKQLIELSDKKIHIQENNRQREGFETRRNELKDMMNQIIPLITLFKLFQSRQLIDTTLVYEIRNQVDQLLSDINLVKDNFNQDSQWILDNQKFKAKDLKRKLNSLINKINQILQILWENYKTNKLPSTNEEILRLLGEINAFKSTVERVNYLRRRIPKELPINEAEFQQIEETINELKQTWESLSSENVPENVIRFLRAAASQGASLKLLTPDVQNWLDKHQITNSLRVRLQ